MRSPVFLAACLLVIESARIVRQVKEHVPSQMCCRCQDSRALCNNDLAKPVEVDVDVVKPADVVDLRESDRPRVTSSSSISTTETTSRPTSTASSFSSTTTCDPLFGCDDDILFGSSEDYLDPVNNEDYDNPNDSVDPADIDYMEPSSGGGSKKVTKRLVAGPTCLNNIECRLFGDCTQEEGACEFEDFAQSVDLRTTNQRCRRGQVLCCNPVPGDLFTSHLDDQIYDENLLDQGICAHPDLAATINFNFGLACGKRDSRVYYDAFKSETEGGQGEQSNPGEWPWSVLIFRRNETTGEDDYVGAGTLLDTDVVATTATKVRDYVTDPGVLRVRLGDWDPKEFGPNSREEFPHVTEQVSCVRQHPQFDSRSLAYNVAILKLDGEPEGGLSVADVVRPRTAPRRPAHRAEGTADWSKNKAKSEDDRSIGEERERRRKLLLELTNEVEDDESFVPPSYINTACLPIDNQQYEDQFSEGQRCWISAWGNTLHEQRELEVPLVSRAECNRLLKPEFVRRGVTNWAGIHSSEVCAGGEGRDACEGEGGAPLVCLDKARDQYFVVGLVNYGFTCSGELPAVYVNMGDPIVQNFITSAFRENFCDSTNS